ncbi:hypothetical protein KSZ_07140 [Dictyobacter formicarum]|uniref:Uncharacterized protein n=1 Tax=Dictyobacter formicarum TaxID=2778368 RepID=A0ABQ3VA84_9CHLR|nr:hypothetical protein KSZ_07140 [Dictyobacter formicarum]
MKPEVALDAVENVIDMSKKEVWEVVLNLLVEFPQRHFQLFFQPLVFLL